MSAAWNCESKSIQSKLFFHFFLGSVQALIQVVTVDELLNNNEHLQIIFAVSEQILRWRVKMRYRIFLFQ